jgi:SAM-dependent methyltransferase
MSDPETLDVYNRQADNYVDMMREYAVKDRLNTTFINACNPNAHVLDLGCGPGHYAVLMANAGLTVDALDASHEMIARVPQADKVTAHVGVFDDIAGADLYDGIWANFSLLHAPRTDIPRHLSALHKALKPGGVFFIGMKMGVGGKRDTIGRHYEYYTKEELETLLQDAGFKPQNHWTGQAKGLDETYHSWIVIHAHG